MDTSQPRRETARIRVVPDAAINGRARQGGCRRPVGDREPEAMLGAMQQVLHWKCRLWLTIGVLFPLKNQVETSVCQICP